MLTNPGRTPICRAEPYPFILQENNLEEKQSRLMTLIIMASVIARVKHSTTMGGWLSWRGDESVNTSKRENQNRVFVSFWSNSSDPIHTYSRSSIFPWVVPDGPITDTHLLQFSAIRRKLAPVNKLTSRLGTCRDYNMRRPCEMENRPVPRNKEIIRWDISAVMVTRGAVLVSYFYYYLEARLW